MSSIKIKDFFNGRFFEIPKYQRGYAWEIQNIRDLFDDIVESIETNSSHYIGTVVLSKSASDDEKFYVVDGQQRITTITMIISCLIRNLSDKDQAYYERFYLIEDDRHRLTPLNRDSQYFINLLNGTVFEPENKSQRFLRGAYEEIGFKVSAIDDKLKFLKSIEKLEVMEFVENSEGDAIRIFQTVNDRGKPLSNMEKAKSLLIYFSNRYLDKKLDEKINDCFSDIFEIYDDIKHLGEELDITLIKGREFNEDNLMRYHFVTFSDENYDPTASYVLQYLKNRLVQLRNSNEGYDSIEKLITSYTTSLIEFFRGCKDVIERAKHEPVFYKLFVVLNLSATLYPLVVKLQMRNLLDCQLEGDHKEFTFYNLIELIEVRVYKTRATDPKADISRLVYSMDNRSNLDIQNWLLWFNSRWMPREEFQAHLYSWVWGNRALNLIFLDYCEFLRGSKYTIEELKEISRKSPSIEHILSQTPTFAPRALGFKNREDFIDFEHTIGNLTLLERGLNSSVQNKGVIDKIDTYNKSFFSMTRMLSSDIDSSKIFTKNELKSRTDVIAQFCLQRWWA